MLGKILVKSLKILTLIFVVGVTVALSFWFGHTVYNTFWNVPQEVEVPNIVGDDASVADNRLTEKGLKMKIIDSRYQEKFSSNTIIKQEPIGGIMVRKGREILTVVSLGPELTEVPDLRGLSQRETSVLLSNSKLKAGKITKVTKPFKEPGEILAQNPQPGQKVKSGSGVNMMVNKGDEPMVKVPGAVGKELPNVDRFLRSSNLSLGTIIWEWNDMIPRGQVIRQIPSPGSMTQPRTKVDVKVSAGEKGFEFNIKEKQIVLFAPKGEGLQTIRVRQIDTFGSNTAYEGQHAPGGKVILTLHSWGNTEIQVYHNTKLVKRFRF